MLQKRSNLIINLGMCGTLQLSRRSTILNARTNNPHYRVPTKHIKHLSLECPGALKTQVQHFVGENVAWEKVTTN